MDEHQRIKLLEAKGALQAARAAYGCYHLKVQNEALPSSAQANTNINNGFTQLFKVIEEALNPVVEVVPDPIQQPDPDSNPCIVDANGDPLVLNALYQHNGGKGSFAGVFKGKIVKAIKPVSPGSVICELMNPKTTDTLTPFYLVPYKKVDSALPTKTPCPVNKGIPDSPFNTLFAEQWPIDADGNSIQVGSKYRLLAPWDNMPEGMFSNTNVVEVVTASKKNSDYVKVAWKGNVYFANSSCLHPHKGLVDNAGQELVGGDYVLYTGANPAKGKVCEVVEPAEGVAGQVYILLRHRPTDPPFTTYASSVEKVKDWPLDHDLVPVVEGQTYYYVNADETWAHLYGKEFKVQSAPWPWPKGTVGVQNDSGLTKILAKNLTAVKPPHAGLTVLGKSFYGSKIFYGTTVRIAPEAEMKYSPEIQAKLKADAPIRAIGKGAAPGLLAFKGTSGKHWDLVAGNMMTITHPKAESCAEEDEPDSIPAGLERTY